MVLEREVMLGLIVAGDAESVLFGSVLACRVRVEPRNATVRQVGRRELVLLPHHVKPSLNFGVFAKEWETLLNRVCPFND